jgi:hypothetical protein
MHKVISEACDLELLVARFAQTKPWLPALAFVSLKQVGGSQTRKKKPRTTGAAQYLPAFAT